MLILLSEVLCDAVLSVHYRIFSLLRSSGGVLRAYKFQTQPFLITSVARNVGTDYMEPTKAKIETFEIKDNKIEPVSSKDDSPICDVRYLL